MIPTLNVPKKGGFGKDCGKRKKNACCQHVLFWSQCFLLYQKGIISFATFDLNYMYLTSANALSLVQSKILLFGKELNTSLRLCGRGEKDCSLGCEMQICFHRIIPVSEFCDLYLGKGKTSWRLCGRGNKDCSLGL